MLLNGLTSNFVVHECCNKVLERRPQLIDYGLVGSFLALLLQDVVHLDDLLVSIGQVILAPHGASHQN